MRSVVVVLPASMWAMMPILRQRLSGTWRAIACKKLRNFETWLDVLDRFLEHLHRIVARLFLHDLQRLVHDPFSRRSLAVLHDRADELGHERTVVDRIRRNLAFGNLSATWHGNSLRSNI